MRPEEKYFSFIFWGPSKWHLTSNKALFVAKSFLKSLHSAYRGGKVGTEVVSWDMSSASSIFAQPQQALVKNLLHIFVCSGCEKLLASYKMHQVYIEEGSQLATFTNQSHSQFSILLFFFLYVPAPLISLLCDQRKIHFHLSRLV